MKRPLNFTVNGEEHYVLVEPNLTLLDLLRDELGLMGTREGCDLGECGACTVIMDGEPILSCMTLAVRCSGKSITTIEGLAAKDGTLHPLQESAVKHDAVQCGYCTPGWLMSAKALLDENPHPTRDQVRAAIAGNLCRCATYHQIEAAIAAVVDGGD